MSFASPASRIFFPFVLLVLALPSSARAEDKGGPWKLVRAYPPESIGPGIKYLRKSVGKSSSDSSPRSTTLHLVHFQSDKLTIKIVDQGDAKPGRYENLAEAMQKNSCLAGCNGGFFHPDFRPSGLVVADGVRINRFEKAKLLSGVLVADDKGPRILRAREFKDSPSVKQLLQSGPFLVDRGTTVAGLSSSRERNRTFILTDGAGNWALGLATRLSLADLGRILGDRTILTEFAVSRALNLDGGSSSSLYFARGTGRAPFHYRGLATVRNFIGIVAR